MSGFILEDQRHSSSDQPEETKQVKQKRYFQNDFYCSRKIRCSYYIIFTILNTASEWGVIAKHRFSHMGKQIRKQNKWDFCLCSSKM